jgi:hypothetical protein
VWIKEEKMRLEEPIGPRGICWQDRAGARHCLRLDSTLEEEAAAITTLFLHKEFKVRREDPRGGA